MAKAENWLPEGHVKVEIAELTFYVGNDPSMSYCKTVTLYHGSCPLAITHENQRKLIEQRKKP